jgi:hypothetical protein
MLELNISFLFHTIIIFFGCYIISLYFKKLYHNISMYKEKEHSDVEVFLKKKNTLNESIENIKKEYLHNKEHINTLIHSTINNIQNKRITPNRTNIITECALLEKDKKNIDDSINKFLQKIR